MLPLAMNVALLLMLSSLLLLTLALQSRLQTAVQRQRREAEDHLMNAAQVLAGRLQRQCPELLLLANSAWPAAHPCAGIEAGDGYRLVSYAPAGGSEQGNGALVLELTGKETAPRAAFALHWRQELAGSPALVGIDERGLRESAAEANGVQEVGS